MDTKSFLIGYLYSTFYLCRHPFLKKEGSSIESSSNQIILSTEKGLLATAINRGIAHIEGNVSYAFLELDKANFDVVDKWTTPECWDHIKKEYGHDDTIDEVRLSLSELVEIINYFGGLDLDSMTNLNQKNEGSIN